VLKEEVRDLKAKIAKDTDEKQTTRGQDEGSRDANFIS